jgi:hypothetical protein
MWRKNICKRMRETPIRLPEIACAARGNAIWTAAPFFTLNLEAVAFAIASAQQESQRSARLQSTGFRRDIGNTACQR